MVEEMKLINPETNQEYEFIQWDKYLSDGVAGKLKPIPEDPAKELFDMVYQWGRVGIVTDHKCPAFQDKIKALKVRKDRR
jgi:hypothetical protein